MKSLSLIAGTGLVSGITFWCVWGHDLHSSVYSGGEEAWYEESYSLQGRVLASVFFAIVISTAVAGGVAVRKLLRKMRRSVPDGASIEEVDY